MKKTLSSILIVLLAFTLSASSLPIPASAESTVHSETTDLQYSTFLASHGIFMPDYFDSQLEWESFAEYVITSVQSDPEYPFVFGYSETLLLCERIREIVKTSYLAGGSPNVTVQPLSNPVGSYTLQDSRRVADWHDDYEDYNCYAFALGLTDSFYNPGDFCDAADYTFDLDHSVYEIAQGVVYDLKSSTFNMDCVTITSTCPDNGDLYSGENAICVRKGDITTILDLDTDTDDDYHFMKLNFSSNEWIHKPGDTALLFYLYTPSESLNWTNEAYYKGEYYSPTITYSGDIHFIIFNSNHTLTGNDFTGNHYHKGTYHYFWIRKVCSRCGSIVQVLTSNSCSGPPCIIPYS